MDTETRTAADNVSAVIGMVAIVVTIIVFIFYRCSKGEDLFQSWFDQVLEKAREEGYREDQIEKFEQSDFFDHYYE
jgi:hypothetical protein